nr:integrase, catalytic region, zinc finger, CCHC-type, peptidase aspartic, catalytic [Tanacetum cinerariifolium]
MRIPLLYRGEYSQWVERFMNYLEEQTDGDVMINSIKNDLWDALARHMLGSEYGEQDMKGDVNDAMGAKKKTIVVTSDPLALIAEKTNVSRSKEKVVVSSNSEGSDADDFSELKKITTLLEKAVNQRKFYSKPTNNNLRTSSSSRSANKKQEFVKIDTKKVEKKDDEKKRDMGRVKCYNCKKEGHFAKDYKKAKVKDYEYYKTKMLLAKKDKDKQVLLAKDQAWMESSSDEIIIDLENEVVNLLEKAKVNLETIKSLKSKSFESSKKVCSESKIQSENNCLVIEKECDKEENPKIVQICCWIIDSGCSKHMTVNHVLLTNFVEKFLEMVRFGNNDFVVIAGYGDKNEKKEAK